MVCNNCHAETPDGSVFCTVCGKKIETESTLTTQQEDNVICTHCGTISQSGAKYCRNCGKTLKSKKSKPRKILSAQQIALRKFTLKVTAICLFVVLLAIVVVSAGVATDWFGLNAPAVRIKSAVQKMLESENFTAEFTYQLSDGTAIVGTAYVSLDAEKEELAVYADAQWDGVAGIIGIYDSQLVISSRYGTYSYDISDQLVPLFEAYGELNKKEFSWKDFLDGVFGRWTYDQVSEYVDFEALDACLSDYLQNFKDKEWLEEYLGYSRSEQEGITYYSFQPDVYSVVRDVLKAFKPSITNEYYYSSISEEFRSERTELDSTTIICNIGLKAGKLDNIVFYGYSGYSDEFLYLDIGFKNVNKTKVDVDTLKELLEEAW